ncbi:CBS domain-containing protein [Spongiactinospora sp. 9N601]|uniref:CBS domain-containing protein n=1 Tax=Spongiactinospora sp. 9N601 TaxID=3375149 RepID=UPI0037B24387
MTSPARTTTPGATITEAARMMDEHGVKRLAVVDREGHLVGIVSQRDLLKMLVRDDEVIAREIRDDILQRTLWFETSGVRVAVVHGVVTLRGWMDRRSETQIAVRLTRRVSGVADVIDELMWKENDATAREGR